MISPDHIPVTGRQLAKRDSASRRIMLTKFSVQTSVSGENLYVVGAIAGQLGKCRDTHLSAVVLA